MIAVGFVVAIAATYYVRSRNLVLVGAIAAVVGYVSAMLGYDTTPKPALTTIVEAAVPPDTWQGDPVKLDSQWPVKIHFEGMLPVDTGFLAKPIEPNNIVIVVTSGSRDDFSSPVRTVWLGQDQPNKPGWFRLRARIESVGIDSRGRAVVRFSVGQGNFPLPSLPDPNWPPK